MATSRDEFDSKIIESLAKRASYICSNPDCRSLTLYPSSNDPELYNYIGVASHITAAALNGPRYDPALTPVERKSIENGIFLCSNCATMIDKNKGTGFPIELLKQWKSDHESWVRANLNRSVTSPHSIVDGEHHAKGRGVVTGLDVQGPTLLKPGTKSTAEGEGTITATRISSKK